MTKRLGTSQNGWPVNDDTNRYVRTSVAGVGFWSANADVATVLDDFTSWYHRTIESITLPVRETPGYDDWSYAVRPVRGQTTGYSNHGSATARDLNATRHPRGVKGTHTAGERKLIAARIATYGGVLRHGEFYSGTIDGMHVEINDDAVAVAKVAARIRAAAAPAKPAAPIKEGTVKDFSTKHELTAADVKAYGQPALIAGKSEKSFGELVRFPPATERVRRELTAQIGALTALVGQLLQAVRADTDLTVQQVEDAAAAGAARALAEHDEGPEDPTQ